MRLTDADALGRLAGRGLAGLAGGIADTHAALAGRVFGGLRYGLGPLATPVRVLHDQVSTASYAGVRAGLALGARAAGTGMVLLPDDGPPPALVAGLNAAWGDYLAAALPALAVPMALRLGGDDVAVSPPALRAGYPDARDRLVVFLPGLGETETAWRYRAARNWGDPRLTYGALLARDLGFSPVFLRYNTGRHIWDNATELAGLLDTLVASWPVPVREVVLVGHSMGGLVARAALELATGSWPALVSATVLLGSPQLGAPLERGTHALASRLARLPETRAVAVALAQRSAGIKDLRHGALCAADWGELGADDWPCPPPSQRRALPPGPRHLAVLVTLARDPAGRLAARTGDLLVGPRSAVGDTGRADALDYPPTRVLRLGGLHHFDLLNHPQVYAQMRCWLEQER